jgi:hypothetical protein
VIRAMRSVWDAFGLVPGERGRDWRICICCKNFLFEYVKLPRTEKTLVGGARAVVEPVSAGESIEVVRAGLLGVSDVVERTADKEGWYLIDQKVEMGGLGRCRERLA